MEKNPRPDSRCEQESETTEEIIGVLNAISVVSKRMAKKLLLLEQRVKKEGEEQDGNPTAANADQGSAV